MDEHDPNPAIEYAINGGDWEAYEGAVALDGDGVYVIEARATDGFGNTEEAEAEVLIDTTAPELEASTDVDDRGAVSVTVNDETSGIERVEYRVLPDGQWLALEVEADEAGGVTSLIDIGDDATTVEFRAVDIAGNVSEIVPVEFETIAADDAPPAGPGTDDSLMATDADPSMWFANIAPRHIHARCVHTLRSLPKDHCALHCSATGTSSIE